jgi:formylglycine-generating enzyme required for sulfatase activity
VEAGAYRIGTNDQDEEILKKQKTEAYPDEKPAHPVTLSESRIGKYLVTNLEFRAFWEAKGYDNDQYWCKDGWQWRTGKWDTTDFSFITDENLRKRYKEWLASRPVDRRDRPFWWDDPQLGIPNLPVVGVCWFEAEAFCKWLSIVTGRHFGLPTEAQWEAAARGLKGRLWPWGNTWDAAKCNNRESEDKIELPSPVGMYPDGPSQCGALDMAGNVWEWCADWFAKDTYEKRAGSAVIDPRGPETGTLRVVRGGSWSDDRSYARCAYRYRDIPDDFYNVGFRLVLSPI